MLVDVIVSTRATKYWGSGLVNRIGAAPVLEAATGGNTRRALALLAIHARADELSALS